LLRVHAFFFFADTALTPHYHPYNAAAQFPGDLKASPASSPLPTAPCQQPPANSPLPAAPCQLPPASY